MLVTGAAATKPPSLACRHLPFLFAFLPVVDAWHPHESKLELGEERLFSVFVNRFHHLAVILYETLVSFFTMHLIYLEILSLSAIEFHVTRLQSSKYQQQCHVTNYIVRYATWLVTWPLIGHRENSLQVLTVHDGRENRHCDSQLIWFPCLYLKKNDVSCWVKSVNARVSFYKTYITVSFRSSLSHSQVRIVVKLQTNLSSSSSASTYTKVDDNGVYASQNPSV